MTFAPTGPGAVGAGEGVAGYRAPILNGLGVWGIPDMCLIGSVIFLGLVVLLNLAGAHNLSRQPVFFCGDGGSASLLSRDVTLWGFSKPSPQVAIRSIAPMHDFSEEGRGGSGLRDQDLFKGGDNAWYPKNHLKDRGEKRSGSQTHWDGGL